MLSVRGLKPKPRHAKFFPAFYRNAPNRMAPVELIHYVLALAFLAIWILAGLIVVGERC